MSTEQSNPLIGRVLADKLRLDALLGVGAAGAVYRAHHLALDKPVAIKVLHHSHTNDIQLVRRFKAEARAASRLDHPNSVRILDFGEDGPDHLLYIAMEFLDGESLQAVLEREGMLANWRIASIMTQVAAALAVAHDLGIVHRDIKPGNVMLLREIGESGVEQEVVKVCDFGLAKVLDANPNEMTGGPLTKQGTIFGTPTYMSPEQANGEAVDGRTDQYACGVIMYRMACGEPPFVADTATGVLMKHILDEPAPVLERAPHLDPRLAALVDRTLTKSADGRFATMRDMLPILREVAETAPRGAVPPVRVPSLAPRLSSNSAPSMPPPPSGLEDTAPSGGGALRAASVSTAPPPASRAPMLAALLGSLALLAVGGLGTYILVGPGARRAQVKPKVAAPTRPPPESVDPAPAPPDAPVEVAAAAPEVPEEPPGEPAAVPRRPADRDKPAARPKPRPTPKEPPEVRPEAKPKPEVKPAPEAAPPPPAPPPAVAPGSLTTKPTAVKPPPTLTAPTLTAKPTLARGPKPLGETFELTVTLDTVDVGGGMSVKKTRDALQRRLPAVKDCLHPKIAEHGVETSGELRVKAKLVTAGRLRSIVTKGGPAGGADCVVEALRSARMPRPDTGETDVEMVLKYRARARS